MKNTNSCRHDECLIRLDYTNMMADAVGDQGFTIKILESMRKKAETAYQNLKQMRANDLTPWMELPYHNKIVRDIMEFRDDIDGQFENLVVLGIGGSALGNIALHSGLNHPFFNLLPKTKRGKKLRVFVADNVDPENVKGMFDAIDPRKTLFNVITKSGATTETIAQFLIVVEMLKEAMGKVSIKKNLVVTTDPKNGLMRKIAKREQFHSFPIPEKLGGRFAILSAAGLFSAAMEGIDIEGLLEGARIMDSRLQEPDFMRNPAYLSAMFQYLADTRQGRNMVVMMPYIRKLSGLTDWYRQLWAESVGKCCSRDGNIVNCGSTPINALGVTDQHSQLQLYTEGPQDKILVFLAADKYAEECAIPLNTSLKEKDLEYLQGSSLELLIQTERIATTLALQKAKRPNMTFILPEVTPCTFGQLIYLLEIQVAFAGELYNVDTFEQPGNDEVKNAIYAMMGRKGFEAKRREIETDLKNSVGKFVC